MAFARTLDFDPRRDGFSFSNCFFWDEADLTFLTRWLRPVSRPVAAAVPALAAAATGGVRGLAAGAALGTALAHAGLADGLVRAATRRWPGLGLCGGMALTALERWQQRAEPPTWDLDAPNVRLLLWRQQQRTTRAAGPAFAAAWLRSRRRDPDFTALLATTWLETVRHIERGEPVLLGLATSEADPFGGHHVLAFGYRAGADRRTILVYDPNAPGRTRRLVLVYSRGRWRLASDLGRRYAAAFVVTRGL
jgi:hypothetical protein